MSEHIDRIHAFAHWIAMGKGHATQEAVDAMTLLADYDALAARLANREALLEECRDDLAATQARLAEQEVMAEYTQNDGNRQWVSVGTWLYPGDRVLFDQARAADSADDDPTPWCSGCGAMRQKDCHCGPIADNE